MSDGKPGDPGKVRPSSSNPPLRFAAGSLRGARRKENADAVFADAEHGLFCVADGSGEQARRAAELVVEGLAGLCDRAEGMALTGEDIAAVLRQQHERIKTLSSGGSPNAFACVAVLWIRGNRATVFHVGVCRAYVKRNGQLRQITRDHTPSIPAGPEAVQPPKTVGTVVTRALGIGSLAIETTSETLDARDTFLLCTDGIHKAIARADLEAFLTEADGAKLDDVVERLMDQAGDRGLGDDMAVAIVAPKRVETVFISHSTEDRPFVEEELIPLFRANGLQTWYSAHDLSAADDWERHILDALRSCTWFLVVLSPSAARSKWVRDEVHWAIEHMESRVIPVRCKPCNPEDIHLRLVAIQYVDYTGDRSLAQRQLLAFWREPENRAGGAETLPESATEPVTRKQGSQTRARRDLPHALIQFRTVSGVLTGQSFVLEVSTQATIGRSCQASLTISDPKVSREHLRISICKSGLLRKRCVCIADTGTPNGSWLNGKPLRTTEVLRESDLISIGGTVLRVEGLVIGSP